MRAHWLQLVEHLQARGRRALVATQHEGIADWLRDNVVVPETGDPLAVLILPDAASLAKWMGRPPDWAHPSEIALNLATAAYRNLGEAESSVGVGIIDSHDTGADDALQVATQTAHETRLYSFGLPARTDTPTLPRDEVLSHCLQTLADTTGCGSLPHGGSHADRLVSLVVERAEPLLVDVWSHRSPVVWSLPGGTLAVQPDEAFGGMLSGSFNPLHSGHLLLRTAAEQYLGQPVCFELPILNADKPPLDFVSIARRRAQFDEQTLALTGAATFEEKAALFPRTTFVVGVDTALRVVDPRFYGDSSSQMETALEALGRADCRLLVAGRQIEDRFVSLGDLAIPPGAAGMFEELPEQVFRCDASSTSIRRDAR